MTRMPSILVVASEPRLRSALASLLAQSGYQVVQAASASRGIRALRRFARRDERPLLIIADLSLDGGDLVRWVHGSPWMRSVPVLGLAPGDGNDGDRVSAPGCAALLPRSRSVTLLPETVRALIGSPGPLAPATPVALAA